ncbi:MAG: PAS domain S-box protein [Bryobacteraceae bacterium]|jgi:PAS domain S-box-containing protein
MIWSSSPQKDQSAAPLPSSPERLRERVQLLEAALDATGEAVVVVDGSGRVLAANAAAARMLRVESVTTLPSEWMGGDSPIVRALRGESVASAELALPGGGGSRLQVSAQPLRRSGDAPAAVVILRQIASGEDALRRERDWAWDIIEAVASLVVVLDRNGHIVRFNPACQAATGYRLEEARGKCFWDLLLLPEEAEPVKRSFGELRAGHFPNYHENYWVAKDGTRRLIAWSSAALLDRNGAVEHIIGTGTDITERKHGEDALREAHDTLRAVIETSPLAIVAMDLQGIVKSWNRAAERMFGWREHEVLNRLFPIVPEDDMEFFRGNLARIRHDETLAGVERQRRRKDGSLIEVELWNAPQRDASGETIGAISVIADVTGRKRLEEQFRQSQKMEAVGRLAGGLAHDFNNLLTIITGYSQMLLDALGADDPQRGNVEEVLRAAESAAALTSQLLAFSRRQIVQPQVLDLNTLVVNMDKMLHRLIGEDIELVTVFSPRLPKVKADPSQLQQVLMNLVVNARDAMPDGGRITIETAAVSIEETHAPGTPGLPAGQYVALSVIDTGRGMDEETRRRLFEPFFTTKVRGKGTGLGLSTAYGIVKQSGGDIWVSTEPGKGSQFRIYLPVAEETAAAGVRAAAVPAQQSGTETVLLVEDETGLRKVVREVLQASGYVVLQAGDGREALRICEQHLGPIHLFLTDVVMPRMSGRELVQHALALRPRMKVLYMSGYADSAILPQGEIEGGSSFLQKPFPPDVLLAKVRQVLDRD